MLHDLTAKQRSLAALMSDLSGRCYSARWLQNLEFILWDVIKNGQRNFGHGVINQTDIDNLIELSKQCGCWIYFDDEKEETSIGLNDWKQKFDETISKDPNIIKG